MSSTGSEAEEKSEVKYISPEITKTILVEGFNTWISQFDPSIITLGLFSISCNNEVYIFQEVALTIQRARDLIKNLEQAIESCLETQEKMIVEK